MTLQKIFSKILFSLVFTLLFTLSLSASAKTVPTGAQLYFPSLNTVDGNPNGKITIVEFFDYRCKYCREMPGVLAQLRRTNPDVRIVYRDYPLLGPVSVFAAQAAVAAQLQNKYLNLHNALYNTKRLTDNQVIALARAQGIDVNRLTQDMSSPVVKSQLQTTAGLAQRLGIDGVPTFIVAKTPSSPRMNKMIPAYYIVSPDADDLRTIIANLNATR